MEQSKELTVEEIKIKERQKQEADLVKHYVSPSKHQHLSPDKNKVKGKKRRINKLARKMRKHNKHKR